MGRVWFLTEYFECAIYEKKLSNLHTIVQIENEVKPTFGKRNEYLEFEEPRKKYEDLLKGQ